MTLEKSLDLIDKNLGPSVGDIFRDGLPDGANPEWCYDEQLVRAIGFALLEWEERAKKRSPDI